MIYDILYTFWTCVLLLVIGLFLGSGYSFSGQNFDEVLRYIKKTVAEA